MVIVLCDPASSGQKLELLASRLQVVFCRLTYILRLWGPIFVWVGAQTWCPTCADMARSQRKKLDVAEMQRTARQFGGEFLSTEYLGAAVKVPRIS